MKSVLTFSVFLSDAVQIYVRAPWREKWQHFAWSVRALKSGIFPDKVHSHRSAQQRTEKQKKSKHFSWAMKIIISGILKSQKMPES
jgi:hypothetical protein